MVYHHTSIASCKSTHNPSTGNRTITVTMSDSVGSSESSLKSRQMNHHHHHHHHLNKKGRSLNSPVQVQPSCNPSQSAIIDIVILIAVIGAFGFLLYPYVKFTYVKFREIGDPVISLVIEEVLEFPLIYASLGLSSMCVSAAIWATVLGTNRKCGNLNCKGLRNAAEFDIQLETKECVKSSNLLVKSSVKRGLFELARDHHRELEAELKKMAPPNGRAVLVFRARCGCSVGRMEVPGLRRAQKIKK